MIHFNTTHFSKIVHFKSRLIKETSRLHQIFSLSQCPVLSLQWVTVEKVNCLYTEKL